jgi:TatD DNase family protein
MHDFKHDINDVINRAITGGVNKILVPGIDYETSRMALDLTIQYPDVLYAAIGIHPNSTVADISLEIKNIEDLAKLPFVYAIGEIGLDFYRDFVESPKQIEIFQEMLEISILVCKPISIHNRNADGEIIIYLQTWFERLEKANCGLITAPGVFHSFDGSSHILDWGLSHNFYFGISGPVTFNKSVELREAVKRIDINHLLLETDSPYLSPAPFRGKRNEPVNVNVIAEKIAEIKGLDVGEVIKKTSENASKLFGWDK